MKLRRAAVLRGLPALLLILGAGCAGPAPQQVQPAADRQVMQASLAGRLAYEQGDYAQAQVLFQKALTRARAIDAADLAADAAFNLALSSIGVQDYAAADRLLHQAEYDAARAAFEPFDIRVLRAKVAYLRERLQEAAALADELIASAAPARLRLQAMLLRAQIDADGGDLAGARAGLQAAGALAGTAGAAPTPSVRADIEKLRGTIARRAGNADEAARAFDAEAALLRTAFRHRDMGHALARAAQAHWSAGRPALAADRFFLAARSLDGQGETDAASAYVESSVDAAGQAGDEAALARARALQEAIARRVAP
jgi:tetratricopeptide (TPR) repeat protein